MEFRLESHVRMELQGNESTWLKLGGPQEVSVRFDEAYYYDEEIDDKIFFVNVTAAGTWDLGAEATAFFREFAAGRIPTALNESANWVTMYRGEFGGLHRSRSRHSQPGYVPERRSLSKTVQDELSAIEVTLKNNANEAVNLLRWRLGIWGSHDPLQSLVFQWSLDGDAWQVAPFDVDFSLYVDVPPTLSASIKHELQGLLNIGEREHLAHSLLREAWSHRLRSPRSALVIGVAAGEVGFKQFASECAPSLTWLIERRPLPRLLQDFLPELLKERADLPSVKLPRRAVIEPIERACQDRNTVVHVSDLGSARYVDAARRLESDLEHGLSAMADLLWFLDYFRGFDWALEHIRKATLEEWRQSSESDN